VQIKDLWEKLRIRKKKVLEPKSDDKPLQNA
jgi:hypothetical protein